MDSLERNDVPVDPLTTAETDKPAAEASSRLVRFSVTQKPTITRTLTDQDLLERAAFAALAVGTRRAVKNSKADQNDTLYITSPGYTPGATPAASRGVSPQPPFPSPPKTHTPKHTHSPKPSISLSPKPSSKQSDNKSAGRISFSLPFAETYSWKHPEYAFTRHSRTFLCGYDTHSYSQTAMDWLLGELVEDGDEVVALQAVETDARWEAEKTLNSLVEQSLAYGKKISIVLEYAIGKFQQVLDGTIEIYEPSILVVGTKGRKKVGFQGLMPGSVSQYCLQHSPIPVIVVKPHMKRARTRAKRVVKNKRAYMEVLEGGGKCFREEGDWVIYNEAATISDIGTRQPPVMPPGWNEGYDDVWLDGRTRRNSL
ncbi:Universal stress protein A family protein [Yarrowia sp. C11]|nr:Universal stress protein A family protein [Yarrowia sp. E02]KAG5367819.1 Universal stress protein A family protein [Yarrowia sp. C11]